MKLFRRRIEAATRGVLGKKEYLKISQNLPPCARTPFIKKETLAEVFSCAFCKLSKNTQKQSQEVFFEKSCF